MTAPAGTAGRTGRIEGPDKAAGRARYSYDYRVEEVAYAWPVTAAIARGMIRGVDAQRALAVPGVLAVLTAANAPRLAGGGDPELALFQSHQVSYRGQFVAAVVADSLEAAQEGARVVAVDAAEEPHDAVLRDDHPGLYAPPFVNPRYATDTAVGDFDAAFAAAPVRVDATYRTPVEHNHPMEPHATIARWDGNLLELWDSNQGPSRTRNAIAALFGLAESQVQVHTQHVGGGFGSKGMPRVNVVLAAMAARMVGRPVKVSLSRQHLFSVVGQRSPSIQRVRLGAGLDGGLSAIAHDVVEQTSTLKEFAEQTAVAARHMYAAPHRRTSHRLVALDVPTPSWVRAPGECPGMFALESAMDELAIACALDPVELRRRNEPALHPESGVAFSSRHLLACLDEGARRFGWAGRDPTPGARRLGRWLVGTGVACSTYPARAMRSQAYARVDQQGRYQVGIGAVDIGTGARTMLWGVAATALGVPPEDVDLCIGDSGLPDAMVAGGSMGTTSWSWAVIQACRDLCEQIRRVGGRIGAEGLEARSDTHGALSPPSRYANYSFGAQFAEVHVDVDTGEVRVPRLLGVFAAGRILNPMLARSQFIGGMTMGLSMALMEEAHLDPAFGDSAYRDLAGYHIATCADVQDLEAAWIDEDERELGPAGAKGIGEVGIVGTAAAIANAAFHATGTRVRDLPLRLDQFLPAHAPG